MADLELKTSAFVHGGEIPTRFTCEGEDVSPPLTIANVPDEARSLALVVDDPDAPSGTFDHWLLYRISPGTSVIPEGTAPPGAAEGKNSWGRAEWGGPCPPEGRHRYFFRLYALDAELDLSPGLTREELEESMRDHVLAEATLVGTYQKTKVEA